MTRTKRSLMKRFSFILIPVLLSGLVVAVVTWRALAESSSELASANRINSLAIQTQYHVAEMGGALKGFLLNPQDTSEMKRKQEADQSNADVLSELKRVAHEPAVTGLVEQMEKLDDTLLNPAEDKVMKLVEEGQVIQARDVFAREYLPLREQYNALTKQLVSAAEEAANHQVALVNQERVKAMNVILSSLAFALLIMVVSLMWTVRSLSRELRTTAERLAHGAQALDDYSQGLATTAHDLSESSSSQASSLQETAAAINQVSSMVARNAESAKKSETISDSSQQVVTKGQDVINLMVDSMNVINQSTSEIASQVEQSNREISAIVHLINEIGDKTKVINDIVFQTRLLSFNASVEAARAGEHGKGFAVVAEEVATLADMSGRAATEITDMLDNSIKRVEQIVSHTQEMISKLVNDSQGKVQDGIATAHNCGSVLSEIHENILTLGQMVHEISHASQEQATGVEQINSALMLQDSMMTKNAESSRKSATMSQALTQNASELRDAVRDLLMTVNGAA